jgi:hypothetical protein
VAKFISSLSKSRTTTIVGGLAGFGGLVLALIPSNIRENCIGAINESENPVILAGLVTIGLILTIIGPSFNKSAKKDE